MINFESHILKQYKSIFYSKIYRPVLNVFGFSLGDFEGTTNYTYDAIGNLISDSGEKIEKIEWTLSGKVKRVVFADKPTLEFVYDPMGNRVAKIKKQSAVPTSWEYTYYSKDASGNTMAVYERKTIVANTATPYANDNNTDILRPTEYPLYGSSRLGNYMPQFANQTSAIYTLQADNVRNYNAPYYTNNTKNTHLNERNYELTDHLGNVSATLSDYKTNNKAQILSAHVYYPFGMEMGIKTRSLGKYRYGFNGMEKDDEIKGEGNSYDFGARMYDSRLGRWFSVDPAFRDYPSMSDYSGMGNNPIIYIDPDGRKIWLFFNKTNKESWLKTWNSIKTDRLFAKVWNSIRRNEDLHVRIQHKTLDGAGGNTHLNTGTRQDPHVISLNDGFAKSAFFEEVFHVGQAQFYNYDKFTTSNVIGVEVEAKVAAAYEFYQKNEGKIGSYSPDDFKDNAHVVYLLYQFDENGNWKDGKEQVNTAVTNYFGALESGNMTNEIKGEFQNYLKDYAKLLDKKGGYDKYFTDEELSNYKGETKYFDSLVSKKKSK